MITELKTNAVAVDEACCTAESGGCDDGLAPSVCTPECGGKLISSELQYTCQLVSKFSIERAENCP